MIGSNREPDCVTKNTRLCVTPRVLSINRLAEQLALAVENMKLLQDPLLNLSAIGLMIEKSQLLLETPHPPWLFLPPRACCGWAPCRLTCAAGM